MDPLQEPLTSEEWRFISDALIEARAKTFFKDWIFRDKELEFFDDGTASWKPLKALPLRADFSALRLREKKETTTVLTFYDKRKGAFLVRQQSSIHYAIGKNTLVMINGTYKLHGDEVVLVDIHEVRAP